MKYSNNNIYIVIVTISAKSNIESNGYVIQMSTTLVSALLTNINGYRSIEKYVEYGKKLLAVPGNKVIFIERDVYYQHFLHALSLEDTTFVFIEKSDLYLYEHIDKITDFCPNTDNPTKDTLEYMFVQCNKTEWIRQAIELDPYGSEQFVWIDFGICHMIRDAEFSENVRGILSLGIRSTSGIRIACGVPHNPDVDLYKTISWFFLGSIFGGDRDSMMKFADAMKQKCIEIIELKHTIMWEVNVWYFIYAEHPEWFSCYRANHDTSILQAFVPLHR